MTIFMVSSTSTLTYIDKCGLARLSNENNIIFVHASEENQCRGNFQELQQNRQHI